MEVHHHQHEKNKYFKEYLYGHYFDIREFGYPFTLSIK